MALTKQDLSSLKTLVKEVVQDEVSPLVDELSSHKVEFNQFKSEVFEAFKGVTHSFTELSDRLKASEENQIRMMEEINENRKLLIRNTNEINLLKGSLPLKFNLMENSAEGYRKSKKKP